MAINRWLTLAAFGAAAYATYRRITRRELARPSAALALPGLQVLGRGAVPVGKGRIAAAKPPRSEDLRGSALPRPQRRLVGWLGIRGVGSLFYLLYALEQGVKGPLAGELVSACLVAIAVSIVAHGVSTTPLMAWYQQRRSARLSRASAGDEEA